MSSHHRAGPRANCRLEGNELDGIQPLAIRRHQRQFHVRIHRGVPVARKMFCCGHGPVFFHPAHELRHKLRHALRIFAERADIDDGIVRVAVHIGHRREHPVHAHGARFNCRDAPHRVGVFRPPRRGHRHGVRECRAFLQAHHRAALEIRANEQWNFGRVLKLVCQHRRFVHVAQLDPARSAPRPQDESADVVFLHARHQLFEFFALHRLERPEIRGKDNLPDFFVRGQPRERALHPPPRGWRERLDGRRIFRVGGHGNGGEKRKEKEQSVAGGHCLKKNAAQRR